jgi:hypothetical protein
VRGRMAARVFCRHGIGYETAANPKSELYGALLPLLNSLHVDLLDVPASKRSSAVLNVVRPAEDVTASITPGGHDDVANAAAGHEGSAIH